MQATEGIETSLTERGEHKLAKEHMGHSRVENGWWGHKRRKIAQHESENLVVEIQKGHRSKEYVQTSTHNKTWVPGVLSAQNQTEEVTTSASMILVVKSPQC